MGAELSVPLSRMPDATTIYQKTNNTIEVMNRILDFLLINSDVRDMISLSDQEKCKNWLIFGKERLSEVFDKVQISPEREKDGTLYIKKLDVLKKSQDKSAENGCRLLAFFFIRLFQVVGALSLSIMDTKLPENDYKSQPTLDVQQEKGRVPLLKIKKDKPSSFLGLFKGGAIKLPDNFIFKEHIIVDPNNENRLILVERTRSGTTIKYTPKPGYTINLVNNTNILFQYNYNDTNEISFIIEPSQPKYDIFRIVEVKRNNLPIRLTNTNYNWEYSTNRTVLVSYSESADEKNKKTIDFTDFIDINLIKEIRLKPISLIGQILKKYDYIDTSERLSKGYYSIRNINILGNSSIQVEINDFLSNEFPTFIFLVKTTYENRNIDIQIDFKIKIIEEKIGTEYLLQIYDLKFIKPIAYKGEPVVFEETEEEKQENTDNSNNSEKKIKTDNPYTRRFTVKKGPSVITSDPTYGTQKIPQFLELRFKNFVKEFLKELGEGFVKSKRGYQAPPKEGMANELKFTRLWRAVAADPPIKAFCTARALQLLDRSGLYSSLTPDSLQFISSTKLPEVVYPHVSNSKFPLIQNKSLPGPGQPITTAEGFAALSTLYKTPSDQFVKPQANTGFFGLFASDPEQDRRKKQDSLEKLIRSFTTDENKLGNAISELSQITDIRPTNVSSFQTTKPEDRAKLRALRIQAIKLFQIQFNHTRKVNQLLNKIFKMEGRIELRPEILSKGVNGIEAIAQEARDLLTEYYAGCQTEYVTGVNILTGKTKVVSRPANNANTNP